MMSGCTCVSAWRAGMSAAATARRTNMPRSISTEAIIPSSSRLSRAKSGAIATLTMHSLNHSNLQGTGVSTEADKHEESASPADDAPRTAHPRRPTLLNYVHSIIAIPLIYFYTIVMGSISLLLSLYDPEGK